MCVFYDQNKSHQRNSTAPIEIALCDAAGNNVSSDATVVQATSLAQIGSSAPAVMAEDSGSANPDYNFRFAGGFYIFNLSLKNSGVGQGEWLMTFARGRSAEPGLRRAVLRQVGARLQASGGSRMTLSHARPPYLSRR